MFVAFDMSSANGWWEERYALLDEVKKNAEITELFVIQFDSAVTYCEVIPRDKIERLIEMPLHGRGGTLITPVQECVRQHGGDKVRVYSDGYFADSPSADVQFDLFYPATT